MTTVILEPTVCLCPQCGGTFHVDELRVEPMARRGEPGVVLVGCCSLFDTWSRSIKATQVTDTLKWLTDRAARRN